MVFRNEDIIAMVDCNKRIGFYNPYETTANELANDYGLFLSVSGIKRIYEGAMSCK